MALNTNNSSKLNANDYKPPSLLDISIISVYSKSLLKSLQKSFSKKVSLFTRNTSCNFNKGLSLNIIQYNATFDSTSVLQFRPR